MVEIDCNGAPLGMSPQPLSGVTLVAHTSKCPMSSSCPENQLSDIHLHTTV